MPGVLEGAQELGMELAAPAGDVRFVRTMRKHAPLHTSELPCLLEGSRTQDLNSHEQDAATL